MFCKSVFTWFAGLWLFSYQPNRNPIIAINNDPTTDLWVPFTPLLGVQIAPEAFPHFEGTGGLYLREGCNHNQALLLTAHHVILPPNEHHNNLYNRKHSSSPCHKVILLGNWAYKNAVNSVMGQIRNEHIMVQLGICKTLYV